MQRQLTHTFEEIISLENLLLAWQEFIKGKRRKKDVQEFQFRLMDNIFFIHDELYHHTYNHGGYQAFQIRDPKTRIIHKASVRDRLLHHAVYRMLYPFFDKTFIADSFSCRKNKGTHKALDRFRTFSRIVSKNNTKTCWVLKCDIKKFFHSIDQKVLLELLKKSIPDNNTMLLLENILGSFSSTQPGKGLPLGNLTSQLFCNIYMNEFDQFVKHRLKIKRYIRYADDFAIFSEHKNELERLLPELRIFLREKMKLHIHPDKVSIKTLASGVDFLGWVHFFDHRVLRTATKNKMLRNISERNHPSYFGLLRHGNAEKIKRGILAAAAAKRASLLDNGSALPIQWL